MKYFRAIVFISIFVAFTYGLGTRAVASNTRDCENHLLLGEVAYSYVGLLELYCRKVTWLSCRDRINQVLSETRFINPFSGVETDSLSIKLDKAFESLREQVDGEQWQVIQTGLGSLRERLQIENQDREQKSVKTAPIFDPHQTYRRDIGREIDSLAWHEAWGTLYLAGLRKNKLFLFPVIDGKTTEDLGNAGGDSPWQQAESVSWIYANDRHYLAVHGPYSDRRIHVFELLRGDELREVIVPKKLQNATVRFATSPVKVNGRDHVVATVNRDLVLLDPSSEGWTERTSISVLDGRRFGSGIHALHTLEWRDRHYIAGIGESGVFIYKVESDSLIKTFESSDVYGSRDHFVQLSGGSVAVSGDHILFAAPELNANVKDGSEKTELLVFDFDLRVESMQSFRLPNLTVGKLSPSWGVRAGRAVLGLSYREPRKPLQSSLPLYSFFEWTGDKLIDAGQFQFVDDFLNHAFEWHSDGFRLFSIFGSHHNLVFLEHSDRQIVKSKILPIPIRISAIASAHYQGHGYVAIGYKESTELLIFDLTHRKRIDPEAR